MARLNARWDNVHHRGQTWDHFWHDADAAAAGDCYFDTVIADAPVAYWRLGEPSGTNANDEIGTLDGTFTGSPTLGAGGALSGDSNTAVTFVASSNQWVSVPDDAVIDLGNGPLSYEIWIKRSSSGDTGTRYIFTKGDQTPSMYLAGSGGSHIVRWDDLNWSSVCHSSINITDTAWHHIVGTKSAANAWLLYIDGVDVTVTDVAGQTTTSTAVALNIGRRSSASDNWFDGGLDEPAIYNYVLTPGQVAAHYAARSVACAGPSTEADAEHASSTGAANNVSASIKPTAGTASATGAANAAAPRVAPTAGTASATGAANAPAPSVGVNAGHASATGAANAAGISTIDSVSAEVATATGAANQPSVRIAVNAGHASATGAANQPGISTTDTAPAGHASSTGAANQPSVAIAVNAGHASATGAAYDATVSTASNTNVSAEHASATGTANAPNVSLAPTAGHAAATGTANQPAAAVGVRAENASATGAAYDATVSTLTNVNANAEHAAATGAANTPGVSVSVHAGHASASAAANQPAARVGASAGGAAALAAAFPASAWVQVGPGVATVTAEAYAALVAIAVNAGTAGGSAAAYDATALGDTTVIGGFPPYATASSFTVRGQAVAAVPGGRSTRPTPGGNATNPKPGAD